jgi:hypothetical protein
VGLAGLSWFGFGAFLILVWWGRGGLWRLSARGGQLHAGPGGGPAIAPPIHAWATRAPATHAGGGIKQPPPAALRQGAPTCAAKTCLWTSFNDSSPLSTCGEKSRPTWRGAVGLGRPGHCRARAFVGGGGGGAPPTPPEALSPGPDELKKSRAGLKTPSPFQARNSLSRVWGGRVQAALSPIKRAAIARAPV